MKMPDPVRIQPIQNRPQAVTSGKPGASTGNINFAETLSQVEKLKFSNHAQKRLESRDINLNEQDLTRLTNAVEKAQAKGSRESLILMDELAFIVNVPQRTVVTTLNRMGSGVFTQIDSVVFADQAVNSLAKGS
jgi:flagellar operon protein